MTMIATEVSKAPKASSVNAGIMAREELTPKARYTQQKKSNPVKPGE